MQPELGFRTILESLGPNSRQEGLTDNTCRFPIRFTDSSASSRAAFSVRGRRPPAAQKAKKPT